MARKRKPYAAIRPWCWYCEASFDSEKKLFEHQRKKHFTCQRCDKKFKSITSLVEHNKFEHQKDLKAVPFALPGRDSVLVLIRGTEGIPECDVLAHNLKSRQNNNSNQDYDESYLDSPQELSLTEADDSKVDPSVSQYQSYISDQNLHMGSGYPEVYSGYPNHLPISLPQPFQQTQPYHSVHHMTGSHFYPDSRYPHQVNHLYSNLYRPTPPAYIRPIFQPHSQNSFGKQVLPSHTAISSAKDSDSQSSNLKNNSSFSDSNNTTQSPHNNSDPSINSESTSTNLSRSLNSTIPPSCSNDDTKKTLEQRKSFHSTSKPLDSSKHVTSRLQREALVFKHPTDKLLSPHAFSPPSESLSSKKSFSNISEVKHSDSLKFPSLDSKSISSSLGSNVSGFISPKRTGSRVTDGAGLASLDKTSLSNKRASSSFGEQFDLKVNSLSRADYNSDESSPPKHTIETSKEVIVCQFKTISMEEARAQDKRYKYSDKIIRDEVDSLETSINRHVALIISKRAN